MERYVGIRVANRCDSREVSRRIWNLPVRKCKEDGAKAAAFAHTVSRVRLSRETSGRLQYRRRPVQPTSEFR